MSKIQLISSKAKELKEISINCLDCNKHIISLLEFPEEEINKLEIECPCGCKFPRKLEKRCKIQVSDGYRIDDIDYELLSKKDEIPKRGRTCMKVSTL